MVLQNTVTGSRVVHTPCTSLQRRLRHAPDGTISIRPDQAQYEKLNENLDRRPHIVKANAVWDLPKSPASLGPIVGAVLNDWQLSGVLSVGSGPAYDLT